MNMEVCQNPDILKIIWFVWEVIKIAFIIIPAIAIVFVSIDLVKNVIASNDANTSNNVRILIKRILYLATIFFIPTIATFLMTFLGNLGVNYAKCLDNANSDYIEKRELVLAKESLAEAKKSGKLSKILEAESAISKLKNGTEKSSLQNEIETLKQSTKEEIEKKIKEREAAEEKEKQEKQKQYASDSSSDEYKGGSNKTIPIEEVNFKIKKNDKGNLRYYVDGKVDKSFTGRVIYKKKSYTIKKGKVTEGPREIRVLFIGNSYSHYPHNALQNNYLAQATEDGYGSIYCNNTTKDGAKLIELVNLGIVKNELNNKQYDLIFFQEQSNTGSEKGNLTTFKSGMKAMKNLIKNSSKNSDTNYYFWILASKRDQRKKQKYYKKYGVEVATMYNVPYIDVGTQFWNEIDEKGLDYKKEFADNIHYSDKGFKRVGRYLWEGSKADLADGIIAKH